MKFGNSICKSLTLGLEHSMNSIKSIIIPLFPVLFPGKSFTFSSELIGKWAPDENIFLELLWKTQYSYLKI